MVPLDKHDQHVAIDHAPQTTGADDAIIREELNRRSDFDRQFTRSLRRLLLQPEAREGDQAWQRKRVATDAAQEVMRRMAFDEKYPHIYKTPEERHRAYAIFHPSTVRNGPKLNLLDSAE